MKKILAFTLALVMVMGLFAACGSKDKVQEPTAPSQSETTAPAVQQPGSALEILEKVWAQYGESERFPVVGGNMENAVMDAPGSYDLTYAENLPYNLLLPAEHIASVDEVASMIHAMNANTFTCGAFHLAEGVSAADFAAVMEEAVLGNMWMCGFPERLVICAIGEEYVVMAFGVNDAMTPFTTHFAAAYPEARTLCDTPIA